MPAGEFETFFNTMRLATNMSENHLPLEEEKNSSSAEATCDMIECIGNFRNKDNVKAPISMRDV